MRCVVPIFTLSLVFFRKRSMRRHTEAKEQEAQPLSLSPVRRPAGCEAVRRKPRLTLRLEFRGRGPTGLRLLTHSLISPILSSAFFSPEDTSGHILAPQRSPAPASHRVLCLLCDSCERHPHKRQREMTGMYRKILRLHTHS